MTQTNDQLMDVQLKLEEQAKIDGRESLKRNMDRAKTSGIAATGTDIGRKLFHHKVNDLSIAVDGWLADLLKPKAGVKPAFVDNIKDMIDTFGTVQEVADICTASTLVTAINAIGSNLHGTLPLNNIANFIGTRLEAEYQVKSFDNWLKEDAQKTKKFALSGIDKRIQESYRHTYLVQAMKKNNYDAKKWSKEDKTALGIHLIQIAAVSTGYFDVKYDYDHNKLLSIVPTPTFAAAWQKNEDNILDHAYKLMPMVVSPKPWTGYEDGGYYGMLNPFNCLLRLKGIETTFGRDYINKLSQLNLEQVLKAVNGVQATPWKINKDVLDVLSYFQNLGYIPCGGEVDINGNSINLVYINEAPKPIVLPEKPTEEEIEAYKKAMPMWYKYEGRRASLANRGNSAINLAKKFKDYGQIYFPHNMDFRGRIYPIPVFSPQGDDLTKSLIEFANPPACESEEDIKYLAIIGANLAGVDKVSYDDRIQWVYDHEEQILKVANDPTGFRWWLEQDEPCQMLAFCFAWAKAKKWIEEHGSIVGFTTGIPYAQDGTCSGLQHFSAILRDPIGGEAVNLTPQDKPNDVYAQVAAVVNEALQRDALNGSATTYNEEKQRNDWGTKDLAQLWLSYGVNRKVTKRPTMTLAYGATKAGYKDQILEDTIKKAMRKQGSSCVFNRGNMLMAAKYMADLIWDAVGKTVVKAREGMDWLHQCARLVTKTSNVVSWVTPLGLLVQQNYVKYDVKVVKLRCMGKRLRIYVPHQTGQIDRVHQAQAVAPNFIHSCDAAHLQLTINRCLDAGITHFAMIHDSYGCPLAQAGLMYRIVRESFVDMYENNDVLKSFRENLQVLTDKTIPEPPSKGTLDLQVVKDSKYIFC